MKRAVASGPLALSLSWHRRPRLCAVAVVLLLLLAVAVDSRSDVGGRMSVVRCRWSDVGGPMSVVRCR